FSQDLSTLIKQHYVDKNDEEITALVKKLTQYL
ncbi:MAG: hypothetical protein ACJATV_001653, partial [Granulosicoccus sp.]